MCWKRCNVCKIYEIRKTDRSYLIYQYRHGLFFGLGLSSYLISVGTVDSTPSLGA
jgi:hypothetical protein